MATAVIELNDISLRCGHGGELVTSPGHALLTRTGVLTGDAARARAWLDPQHSFDQHWHQLGLSALGVTSRYARHFADLAHAQLLDLQRAAGEPGRVVFAVPGSFSRDQLAALLGIAGATPLAVAGLVDAAVAAVAYWPVTGPVLHLDLQRHCAVLTTIAGGGGEWRRQRVTVLPDLGLKALHAVWAQFIADRFIATYRYDPLHTGAGEQALHDALPGWLAALAREEELTVTLAGSRGPQRLQLAATELAQAARSSYEHLARRVREAADGFPSATLVLSHRLKDLPGVHAWLTGEYLPAEAAIAGCLTRLDAIAAHPANVLLTALPAVELLREPPPSHGPAAAPARPRASHLLFRHRARAIGSGLLIEAGPRVRSADAGEPLLPDTLLLGPADGRLALRGSLAGAELDGDPADLRAGDRLRIGTEALELIEVG